jgi:hypothetical protein
LRSFLAIALLCITVSSAVAAPPPKITDAKDGFFEAFKSHSVVGLVEWHGLAQEMDFYVSLITDPRFARDVGNILLETGDASQQSTVDRYVNGEDVPYEDLRKVWADTVGTFPTVTFTGSINLYSVIRDVNRALPQERRIKVWLGDPPIDWSQIRSKADWEPIEKQRDSYPADLIKREIITKGKKALLIYGVGHLARFPDWENIRSLIDKAYPNSLFVVSPYVGFAQAECAANFEKQFSGWPVPSLVGPVHGSTLEGAIAPPGCGSMEKRPAQSDSGYRSASQGNLGFTSNAILYLGARESFLLGPQDPDIYLDLQFRKEMNRRMSIRLNRPLEGYSAAGNRSVPRSYWPQ